MLTGKQVRERLGIEKETFLKLVQTGQLTAIRAGSAPNSPYRVSEESLQAFIKANRVKVKQAAS